MSKDITFIRGKGMCKAGHAGSYQDSVADRLVKEGYAEYTKTPAKEKPHVVKKSKTKIEGDI